VERGAGGGLPRVKEARQAETTQRRPAAAWDISHPFEAHSEGRASLIRTGRRCGRDTPCLRAARVAPWARNAVSARARYVSHPAEAGVGAAGT